MLYYLSIDITVVILSQFTLVTIEGASPWDISLKSLRKTKINGSFLVEDTGHVTITNLLLLLFPSFFCTFVLYCFAISLSKNLQGTGPTTNSR